MTKTYSYTVEPLRPYVHFPIDMLRYDSAWPEQSIDAGMIERLFLARGSEAGSVNLLGQHMPTRERWESFGWKVVG